MASVSFQIAGKTPNNVKNFLKTNPNATYGEIRKVYDLPVDPDDRSEEISELKDKFIKKLKKKFDGAIDFFIKQAGEENKPVDAKKFKSFLRRYKVVALACENTWEELEKKMTGLIGPEKEAKIRLGMKKCFRCTETFDRMVAGGFYDSFLAYQKTVQQPMNANASDISDAEIIPSSTGSQNNRPKSNK